MVPDVERTYRILSGEVTLVPACATGWKDLTVWSVTTMVCQGGLGKAASCVGEQRTTLIPDSRAMSSRRFLGFVGDMGANALPALMIARILTMAQCDFSKRIPTTLPDPRPSCLTSSAKLSDKLSSSP